MKKMLQVMWALVLGVGCTGIVWAQARAMDTSPVKGFSAAGAVPDFGESLPPELTLGATGSDLDEDWATRDSLFAADSELLAIRHYKRSLGAGNSEPVIWVLRRWQISPPIPSRPVLGVETFTPAGAQVAVGGPAVRVRSAKWTSQIDGATFGPQGLPGPTVSPTQVYFIGTVRHGTSDMNMVVICLDTRYSDKLCPGWPTRVDDEAPYDTVSASEVPFDLSPEAQDVGRVIEYVDQAGAIFGAGQVLGAGTNGGAVGVFKMKVSDGSLDAGFGTGGKKVFYLGNGKATVNASSSGWRSPGHGQFVVGGSYQPGSDLADRDGYVLAIDTNTGEDFLRQVWFEADNAGDKKDEVTALAVLKTGKVAFAGWSETDDANFPLDPAGAAADEPRLRPGILWFRAMRGAAVVVHLHARHAGCAAACAGRADDEWRSGAGARWIAYGWHRGVLAASPDRAALEP